MFHYARKFINYMAPEPERTKVEITIQSRPESLAASGKYCPAGVDFELNIKAKSPDTAMHDKQNLLFGIENIPAKIGFSIVEALNQSIQDKNASNLDFSLKIDIQVGDDLHPYHCSETQITYSSLTSHLLEGLAYVNKWAHGINQEGTKRIKSLP